VLAGCLTCLPLTRAYGAIIVDPATAYTNSTGGGGLGSFNSSGLDPGFDDNEVLFRFTAAQAGTLTAFTTSFANGGFAPDLTLFADDGAPGDPTGAFITQGLEGITGSCGPTQGTDAATGFQYPPFTPNPSPPPNYLPSQNDFNNGFELFDNPGLPRTANYDVEADFTASESANTPEPGSLFLLFIGLTLIYFSRPSRLSPPRSSSSNRRNPNEDLFYARRDCHMCGAARGRSRNGYRIYHRRYASHLDSGGHVHQS
jgi:hypothetical protein